MLQRAIQGIPKTLRSYILPPLSLSLYKHIVPRRTFISSNTIFSVPAGGPKTFPKAAPFCCNSFSSSSNANPDENNPEVVHLVKEKIALNTVMVFSKSYCPYCKKAKDILQKYGVKYEAFEIDQDAKGAEVQKVLAKLTGQSTVPNIFIGAKHIGGSDKLASLDREGKLLELLQQAGITSASKGEL